MKVLIIHPEFKNPGGVSNYFSILKDKFNIETRDFVIGRRITERKFIFSIFRLIRDYINFVKILKNGKYDIVHINPSLNFKGVMREGLFLLLAKYLRTKVIVFFRGWNKRFEKKIERNGLWIFQRVYSRADAFIVLANQFKERLRDWKFKQPIYLETTIVDDNLLYDFDINKATTARTNSCNHKILFLARIVRKKGIYETIDAVALLKNRFSNVELVIAGIGEELQNVKDYVKKHNLSNVIFAGYVKGEDKKKLLEDSYIYYFPTYYEEGMPNSAVEASAFGLPVVTRIVGGLADFFKNGENGFISESKNPTVFAGYIERLILDRELYKKISLNNYNLAQERFLASKAARRLEKIYYECV